MTIDGVQDDPRKICRCGLDNFKECLLYQEFPGLASFYRSFIQNFSSVIACCMKFMKGHIFKWTNEAKSNFQLVKQKMIEAPMLGTSNL